MRRQKRPAGQATKNDGLSCKKDTADKKRSSVPQEWGKQQQGTPRTYPEVTTPKRILSRCSFCSSIRGGRISKYESFIEIRLDRIGRLHSGYDVGDGYFIAVRL